MARGGKKGVGERAPFLLPTHLVPGEEQYASGRGEERTPSTPPPCKRVHLMS